jgi:hypothetical protein
VNALSMFLCAKRWFFRGFFIVSSKGTIEGPEKKMGLALASPFTAIPWAWAKCSAPPGRLVLQQLFHFIDCHFQESGSRNCRYTLVA